jgi:transcription termination factor 2
VWNCWLENKTDEGAKRLQTVINSLTLRRTKRQLQGKGTLHLPQKIEREIPIELDEEESAVYEEVKQCYAR